MSDSELELICLATIGQRIIFSLFSTRQPVCAHAVINEQNEQSDYVANPGGAGHIDRRFLEIFRTAENFGAQDSVIGCQEISCCDSRKPDNH